MIQIEEKDLKEAVTMALGSQGIWTPELASTIFIEIQKQALNIDDVSVTLLCDVEKGTKCKDPFPKYDTGVCRNCFGQSN
jgi:hypothetical protein